MKLATTVSRFMGLALAAGLLAPLLAAPLSTPSHGGMSTLSFHVTDADGKPLTSRVRVAPSDPVERVRLQMWRDLHVIASNGRAAIEITPGDYEISVSHGSEWSLDQATRKLRPGLAEHRVALTHQVSLPGWHAADLHVHTDRSRDAHAHGGVSVAALHAEGIELAVSTDHNRIGDMGEGFESVAGAEITTWQPEVGHFNAFPLRQLPTWSGITPKQLFAELKRDPKVFVQVNHPRLDDHIAYFKLGGFDGASFADAGFDLDVHGLEVWNGYDIGRYDQVLALIKEWRGWVASGRRLTATGGSDCHGADGHHPGYPRTYVPVSHASELAPALQAGRAFVSNGPLLGLVVDGLHAGETAILASNTVTVSVTVMAPDWMHVDQVEVWAGDNLVWSQTLPRADQGPVRFETQITLRVDDAKTLHAVAHGGSGLDRLLGRGGVVPLAFTNPIYLERHAAKYALRNTKQAARQ